MLIWEFIDSHTVVKPFPQNAKVEERQKRLAEGAQRSLVLEMHRLEA